MFSKPDVNKPPVSMLHKALEIANASVDITRGILYLREASGLSLMKCKQLMNEMYRSAEYYLVPKAEMDRKLREERAMASQINFGIREDEDVIVDAERKARIQILSLITQCKFVER